VCLCVSSTPTPHINAHTLPVAPAYRRPAARGSQPSLYALIRTIPATIIESNAVRLLHLECEWRILLWDFDTTPVHARTHAHASTHTQAHAHTHARAHTHTHTRKTHTHTHTHSHSHTHTCTCTHTPTHMLQLTHALTHTHTHTHSLTFFLPDQETDTDTDTDTDIDTDIDTGACSHTRFRELPLLPSLPPPRIHTHMSTHTCTRKRRTCVEGSHLCSRYAARMDELCLTYS